MLGFYPISGNTISGSPVSAGTPIIPAVAKYRLPVVVDKPWYEWDAYRQKPYAAWYRPQSLQTRQANQRIDIAPDLTATWWQTFQEHILPQTVIPPRPPTRQPSQLIVTLPDFWVEYQATSEEAYAQWYVPGRPPTRQLSQRIDPLPDYNQLWWQQKAEWPIPQSYVPPSVPPRQLSQRLEIAPDLTHTWWQQKFISPPRIVPPLSTFFTSQEGVSGVYAVVTGIVQTGGFRVENVALEGYNVYIGENVQPDLTQNPTLFSSSLPISVPITPPGVGTKTVYVLITKQDLYGLESQNQFYSVFGIDTAGNLVLPPLAAPQDLRLFQMPGTSIRILASYPGYQTDKYKATQWRIWTGTTPPNPVTDPVYQVAPVSRILATSIGPFTPGLKYVTVGLFRADDSNSSPTITDSVVISTPPDTVTPVPSGFQLP
jgi:hypothetical protein